MTIEKLKNNKSGNNPFPAMEEDVLNFWDKSKIFEKSVNNPPVPPYQGGKTREYIFYDGPPFATGTPHYGHIVASAMKDVVPRYWTMKGYRVERKWGWDCHGLPIENIVEKEMGIKNKKEIEKFGVEKFNETCRSKVLSYVEEWKKVIRRLGRWADMENAYKTMDLNFMESVWWVFKQLWDKGLIYEGYRSMAICPHCETTLSQQEIAEGYKMVKDLSATVKFELINPTNLQINYKFTNKDKVYVLAWTTTPWTLIGNVALAINQSIKYQVVSIKGDDSKYIIAKDRVETVLKDKKFEIVEEFKGQKLIGKKYKPLFNYYLMQTNADEKQTNKKKNPHESVLSSNKSASQENGWKIYSADFVTTKEGTGVVHIATAFGEDDMNLGKENNLPFIQHVNMDGTIKEEVGDFAGMNVKPIDDTQKTDVEIIKYLARNGLLFSKEKYEHSYPHCWRCETPLINYATNSWFVAITKVKEKTLELAQKINWSPAHIKEGRFGNWLSGSRDWSISRQRFWASVMPIWRCSCGEIKVVGSVKELEDLCGQKIVDLHKHIIDKIIFNCEKCGGVMERVPDVLDTWFDSGSMPYAQTHYPFENKEKFEANFPAEFIAEGIDQTRAWFYYLHIIGTAIKNSHAFKNVIVNGIVLAEDGKKMSKRLNNYSDPMEIFDKYGADAMRYYLISSSVMSAENLNFSEKGVKEALQKNIMVLWNVYKFYELYENKLKVKSEKLKVKSENILDKWILVRLKVLIKEVTENMENYNLPKAARPIEYFINDLSTWYLRRSRDRFKDEDTEDKQMALATTNYVLSQLSKVMAPFMPFISEQIWQKVTGYNFNDENKSAHLEAWPKQSQITNYELAILEQMEEVRKIVELGLAKRDEAGIKVRQPLSKLKVKSQKHAKSETNGLKVSDEHLQLIKDELNVKKIELVNNADRLEVELDINISVELKLEGIKREIVRQINMTRKEAMLTIKDKITLSWQSKSTLIAKTFSEFSDEIKKETLAIEIINNKNNLVGEKIKINNEEIILFIEKI
ncbi:MAG: isoleucine--tRNA ligase [Patescibacteria group bacterium]